MTGKRKRYSADFKAKVALDALSCELTTAQLASKHGIHPTIINDWKRQAVSGLPSLFINKSENDEIKNED
jgi:transposase